MGRDLEGALKDYNEAIRVGYKPFVQRASDPFEEGTDLRRAPANLSHQDVRDRLMAWSNWARSSRTMATLGWSGPKLASSMASARRISGSASKSRLVSLSNRARLLRPRAGVG
jgi:hypothetical protein